MNKILKIIILTNLNNLKILKLNFHKNFHLKSKINNRFMAD